MGWLEASGTKALSVASTKNSPPGTRPPSAQAVQCGRPRRNPSSSTANVTAMYSWFGAGVSVTNSGAVYSQAGWTAATSCGCPQDRRRVSFTTYPRRLPACSRMCRRCHMASLFTLSPCDVRCQGNNRPRCTSRDEYRLAPGQASKQPRDSRRQFQRLFSGPTREVPTVRPFLRETAKDCTETKPQEVLLVWCVHDHPRGRPRRHQRAP